MGLQHTSQSSTYFCLRTDRSSTIEISSPQCGQAKECSINCSLLAHPDAPRDRPGFLIGHWKARHLKGQLYLTMMVALMPDHVLEHEDRMVVVKFHVPACLHTVFYCVSHNLGAVLQDLRDAIRIAFGRPLFLGQASGELRGVLEDEHKSYIVNVCDHLRAGW